MLKINFNIHRGITPNGAFFIVILSVWQSIDRYYSTGWETKISKCIT